MFFEFLWIRLRVVLIHNAKTRLQQCVPAFVGRLIRFQFSKS